MKNKNNFFIKNTNNRFCFYINNATAEDKYLDIKRITILTVKP